MSRVRESFLAVIGFGVEAGMRHHERGTSAIWAGVLALASTGMFAAADASAATVTVTKISNGGVGAFIFTGTNGFASQTITTTTPGVGVTGATQTLTSAGTSTSITETAPPGYVLVGTTCTGLGAGGTATRNGNTVTLDAAATASGANIACTFTNTRLPTVTVTKISNGGVAAFTFTGSNGFVSQTITTTTAGVGVAGATQALAAAGVATSIAETSLPEYDLASANCTGMGAGGTAMLNGNTVTLDTAATAPGANIACTFTNTRRQMLTVNKAGNGSGTVTSDVGGIDCGATCSANYIAGTPVVLAATPGAGGSVFAGWGGAGIACPGTGTCAVTMDAFRTVTATFTDSAPPTTTLFTTPSSPTNQPLAVFTFGADEPSSFECSLDGQPFAPCTSPASYTVGNGPQVFAVRARDTAGNLGSSETFGWLVVGIGQVAAIPTLSAGLLALLAAMLGALGVVARRRR